MNFDPFDDVNCKYGSPMGRVSDAPGNFVDVPRTALRAVHEHEGAQPDTIDPGYDKGGAYWGLPDNVWAVWVDHPDFDMVVRYVRACSAGEALDKVQGVELDEFTQAYIEAMYFTDGQGIDEDGFDGNTMLSPEAFEQIKADCEFFQGRARHLLEDAYETGQYDAARAGHDFWLTRNGHGSGFWDRKELDRLSTINATLGDRLTKVAKEFRSLSLVKGDDGLLYLE